MPAAKVKTQRKGSGESEVDFRGVPAAKKREKSFNDLGTPLDKEDSATGARSTKLGMTMELLATHTRPTGPTRSLLALATVRRILGTAAAGVWYDSLHEQREHGNISAK